MMLSVDVWKSYGSFRLHAKFDTDGGTLALLGASGSGKSLTLRMIAGITKPDEGRIVLNGRVLFDSEKRINLTPQQRRVGYLFQQYALFPNMTVEGNIAAGIRGYDRKTRRARVAEAVRAFRLDGLERMVPKQLSGGQQQRVALARILVSEPCAILLDEPFAALDGHLKWQLEQELSDTLNAFSGSVLFVTHDAGEVYRNCSRVVVLDAGAASPVMPVSELFNRPQTVGAAMLAGCHTFAPVERVSDGVVRVPPWNVTFRCDNAVKNACVLSMFDDRIRLCAPDAENATECRVLHATDDVHGGVLTLVPVSAAENAPRIRMALPADVWYTVKNEATVWVSVSPADILLLP